MELSPSALNRLANSSLGATPAVVGIAYAAQASTGIERLAACFAVSGFAILAVRGYRLGVTCEHSRMVVRGLVRTRVIARERITEITDFPAVRWTTQAGKTQWTPITALVTSSGEMSATRLHKERAIGKLRRWARGKQ
ncbi:hypothetical protein [Streptomyces aurantiogriseus]|uniref:Uncharacterized protein n=1 Tax=Streptomyces aurantiogriseus TaxID=66870 RepID=A0A918F6V3_9ACTN|nr:hypothetical protein [Streptomyces aurantiogriseus]GGR06942.1 hypothetical protein GCM10010251_23430 [Streptomyces aurantiogriseus]